MNRKPKEHTMKKPDLQSNQWFSEHAVIWDATGEVVAVTHDRADTLSFDERWVKPVEKARATAIAALPDLLSALEFVLGNCDPSDEKHFIPKECRSSVERALTKAGYTF